MQQSEQSPHWRSVEGGGGSEAARTVVVTNELGGDTLTYVVDRLSLVDQEALRAALETRQKAARAAAILAMVGIVNVPIIKVSVDRWAPACSNALSIEA